MGSENYKNKAQEFVNNLMSEGDKVSCDDSNSQFHRNNQLPPFYDKNLYKRGQKFFHDNVFSMFYNMLLGLLGILAVPSIRRILMQTRMSGTDFTAYRRYLGTILHVKVWYEEEPTPGSRMWKSLTAVRKMHNSASNRGSNRDFKRISQKDMALTQVGFIGISIVRSKFVGIHEATEEELRAFIHVWRVLGHLLGIEDKFNICRESVQETQEICNILMEKVFHAEIQRRHEDFLSMSYYFIKGVWYIAPYFQYKSILCILDNITRADHEDMSKPVYFQLNRFQKIHYWFMTNFGRLLQYKWLKKQNNYIFAGGVWLMKCFPFLALYYYGMKYGRVDIGI